MKRFIQAKYILLFICYCCLYLDFTISQKISESSSTEILKQTGPDSELLQRLQEALENYNKARQDDDDEDIDIPSYVPDIIKVVGNVLAGNASSVVESSVRLTNGLLPGNIGPQITNLIDLLTSTINENRPLLSLRPFRTTPKPRRPTRGSTRKPMFRNRTRRTTTMNPAILNQVTNLNASASPTTRPIIFVIPSQQETISITALQKNPNLIYQILNQSLIAQTQTMNKNPAVPAQQSIVQNSIVNPAVTRPIVPIQQPIFPNTGISNQNSVPQNAFFPNIPNTQSQSQFPVKTRPSSNINTKPPPGNVHANPLLQSISASAHQTGPNAVIGNSSATVVSSHQIQNQEQLLNNLLTLLGQLSLTTTAAPVPGQVPIAASGATEAAPISTTLDEDYYYYEDEETTTLSNKGTNDTKPVPIVSITTTLATTTATDDDDDDDNVVIKAAEANKATTSKTKVKGPVVAAATTVKAKDKDSEEEDEDEDKTTVATKVIPKPLPTKFSAVVENDEEEAKSTFPPVITKVVVSKEKAQSTTTEEPDEEEEEETERTVKIVATLATTKRYQINQKRTANPVKVNEGEEDAEEDRI